jgi:hypothetical protein
MKQADLRDMSVHQLIWYSLSPTPSTSSAVKAPENTEKDHDDPEPAGEGVVQMEYFSD